VRGRGAARALIEGVAASARDRGADRLYWHTQEDNAGARVLYDKVARFTGFIRATPIRCNEGQDRAAAALTPSMNNPMPNR
jgi:ribosomal protein S18 acetylase RimI-like enzyme